MDLTLLRCRLCHSQPSLLTFTQSINHKLIPQKEPRSMFWVHRKNLKHHRYECCSKLSPDSRISTFVKPCNVIKDTLETDTEFEGEFDASSDKKDEAEEEDENVWEADEIEAISSLFQGRIPQKPGKLNRKRPLPLPLPHKVRPLGLPTVKKKIRTSSLSKQLYKDPNFLLNLAREIRRLPVDKNASSVLIRWGKFLQKGSLSLTIRELGHMGLPERALETFSWAQNQTHLFPDDRILSATVETLARAHELKLPCDLKKFVTLASRSVLEATARGFIKGKSLNLAWKLLSTARKSNRMLGSSIYAMLILELGKNPEKENFVLALLENLAERDSLDLNIQDCSALMKVCVRLGKYEYVECLFDWFRNSGNQPSVVMYTTLIHSRFSAKNYKQSLALVWEMERLDCLYDMPAYRVVIKLFVALNDLPRAVRYFSKMKEAGFSPTYDLYRDMIRIYLVSGRIAKCWEISKEVELAGYKLDAELRSELLQHEKITRPSV